MKKFMIPFLCCFFFGLLLRNSTLVIEGASEGLLLWYRTVLPNLFPFFVAINLIISTGAIRILESFFAPVFSRIFHVTPPSALAILGGFLCGYPMGARIVSDLCDQQLISKTEGHYLLSFCNNASPMFIVGFFVTQSLKRPDLMLPSLVILYLSPICSSFLFRNFYAGNKSGNAEKKPITFVHSDTPNFMLLLDKAIWNGMETILKIGGYIICFSILVELLTPLSEVGKFWKYILIPSLEITNGISMLSDSKMLGFGQKYLLMMVHISFGGFCAMFQTQCVLKDFDFHLDRYILEKLVTATITSLLCCIYLFFFSKFSF